MGWQKTFDLPRLSKGCHLVTDDVLAEISEGIEDVKVGMLFLFIQHTSAALSINENFDADVRKDMDMALDTIVPETLEWRHTNEGRDDSVSHTKATIVGSTISVPITDGSLNLGTWQGIYLTEFRHIPHTRRVVATVLS
jgi:secondary thiamine-phosphate synthase enzyme